MESTAVEKNQFVANGGHTFHIPVMGTGFTIDTPLKVARYGISSVVSITDDILVEQMRKFHCEQAGEEYAEISHRTEDFRALRMAAYLDLLDRIVKKQVEELRASPFEEGSEITRYYELLPETPLKRYYREMLETTDPAMKESMREELRAAVEPGPIDVNIMTKLDADNYRKGKKLPPEFSDAKASLRGFAKSALRSSVIFSAGMNQGLYAYVSHFDDFLPDSLGILKKKIILKVSDYRSALIQGKFLAKKGLWVSEYRVESGLNCGGHAFATKGHLMGPILEEFKEQKDRFVERIHGIYTKGLESLNRPSLDSPPEMRVTVQGGIGTAHENNLLHEYYKVDGTGWATPFLLVPEVCNVDDAHSDKLRGATEEDVFLSDSSPLGVPFWNLRNSASEDDRRRHIEEGNPGSPCPKRFLVSNTEFTEEPICPASNAYQKRKLPLIAEENPTPEQQSAVREGVLAKSCLCRDLSGGAEVKTGIHKEATSAICCGPNIANFANLATLEEMVGHIYGRLSILTNPDRPHMFITELKLYVEYLAKEMEKYSLDLSVSTPKYFQDFKDSLLSGIEYYRERAEHLVEENSNRFLEELSRIREELEHASLAETTTV